MGGGLVSLWDLPGNWVKTLNYQYRWVFSLEMIHFHKEDSCVLAVMMRTQ